MTTAHRHPGAGRDPALPTADKATPREQRLFAAARHYMELTPMPCPNFFRPGTLSHAAWEARKEAEDELTAALAACEGTATAHPDNGSR